MTADPAASPSSPSSPSPPSPPVPPEPRAADAVPFAAEELRACLVRPQRTLDVVLVERERLAASVRKSRHLVALVGILLLCGVAFSVPFGLVDGPGCAVDVPTLLVGSVLLCFPSLQVFGAYLGLRLSLAQNLAIALLIPAAAALFTFGFFPIHWFLLATTEGSETGSGARVVLLACALLLGLSHCNRVLFLDRGVPVSGSSRALWLAWQGLVLFVSFRMAKALGLLA